MTLVSHSGWVTARTSRPFRPWGMVVGSYQGFALRYSLAGPLGPSEGARPVVSKPSPSRPRSGKGIGLATA